MTGDARISVTLNGKKREFAAPVTLLGLLEVLGVADAVHIAVARNGEVKRREELASEHLSDGDAVEVVRAVGGGAGACFGH